MPYAKREDRQRYEREYRHTYRQYGRDKLDNRRWRKKRRQKWFATTSGHCTYCGKKLTWQTAERDHILPRTLGGTDAPENIAIACRKCNASKGERAPYGWKNAANGTGNPDAG